MGGYPGLYSKGQVVTGWESFKNTQDEAVFLFQAGTTSEATGGLITNGGRVFNLIGLGQDLGKARQRVYNVLEEGRIGFEGMRYRKDIAAREQGN